MRAVKKILIVEDDALIAMNLMETLNSFGYATDPPVATADDAVFQACAILPDLILMDIQLAGKMTGIEAAAKIRQTHDIPIIYLTAFSDEERLREAISTEPYAYLIKPVQNQELRTSIEVTLYKHLMDKALRESEERYHTVITQAIEGIILFNLDTNFIIETNPAVKNLSGYTEEDFKTMKLSDLLPSAPLITESRFTEPGCLLQYRLGEQKLRCKDSSFLDVECTSSLIKNDGKSKLVCLIVHDVTERKKAETALFEANKKLNLLGEITRHDVLNQIMALRSYFQFSKVYVKEPAHADLYRKEEEIIRILERQIIFTRDYQNMGVKRPEWQNVAEIVKKAVSALDVNKIQVDTGRRDLELFADPLLEKVFYNLLDNSLRYGDERMTSIRILSREDENGLVVSFEDNGIGIPHDKKEMIFHHGFGKNTGLGLFLVREILGITGMTIKEQGVPGECAQFEIRVPKGQYRFKKLRE
jgi:PAS domain S-box-containing protein